MGKIVWLASYPKAGNTWMRALLTNYLRDGTAPASINELDGGPIASNRALFDEWVGVEASALSEAVVERLRPGVYRCLVRETPETLYMKVHDAWGRTDRGEPLFPAEVTAGVIYILRNPLDLAVSWAHFFEVSVEKAVEDLCDSSNALFRSQNGPSGQLRQNLHTWSGHVQSWLNESGLPVYPVRYEDLHVDTPGVFGGVVRFCGLPFDGARLRKAVAFSDFAELQRQEREKGYYERFLASSAPFFRRGQVGSWHEELPPALAQRLIKAHAETMRRFGYLEENDPPV